MASNYQSLSSDSSSNTLSSGGRDVDVAGRSIGVQEDRPLVRTVIISDLPGGNVLSAEARDG